MFAIFSDCPCSCALALGEFGQKTEQGVGDRRGALHLDPVAGAADIYLAAQVGHEVVHQIAPAAAVERQDRILLAGDEQCWPLDLGRLQLEGECEVPVDVPIPVERPAESVALKLDDAVV